MPRRTNRLIESQKPTTLDFTSAVELFLREQKIKHLSPKTIKWHSDNLHVLEKVLTLQGIDMTPSKITTRILKDNFLMYMMEVMELSPATINGRIRTLKSFFDFLTKEKYLRTNPNTLKEVKARKHVIQAFDVNQVKKLLSIPDRNTFTGLRDYTIMMLMLETGMRVSELAGIQMGDIRWRDNKILVLGKGDKERLVPFQRQMRRVLEKYVEVRGEVPGEDHLFITVDNTPMIRRNIQERITFIGRAANLNGVRVSPHTFRHTFAKLYILNGGDIFSLQAILGHTTLDMVRNYVNLFGNDVEKQHRKFSPIENL